MKKQEKETPWHGGMLAEMLGGSAEAREGSDYPFSVWKLRLGWTCFVPIPLKDNNLHLIETRQHYERSEQDWCRNRYRLSYSQFVDWHNPLGSKNRQVLRLTLRWRRNFVDSLSV